MVSIQNIKELGLTENQEMKLKEFELKEKYLREWLWECGFRKEGIDLITSFVDLNRVSPENLKELEEGIKAVCRKFIAKERKHEQKEH